ncbi:hypothetical protein [Rhodococcus sp. BE178]|uniref:hypothetical protein n=1 Tax=Rhodococcus sp. BE178 TaxID=2817737 RepID=UPI003D20BA31
MRFTECEDPEINHADNERCYWCNDADLSKFDGERYTAAERRRILFIWGERSRQEQDKLLAELGDDLIDRAVELLESITVEQQAVLLQKAFGEAQPLTVAVTGQRYRAVQMRDPRNVFNPSHLRRLRDFYRRHGRLPAVITVSFTEEEARKCGLPPRVIVPPEMRADLAHRFDLEQEPEFF